MLILACDHADAQTDTEQTAFRGAASEARIALDKDYLSRADVCDAKGVYRRAEQGLERFVNHYPQSARVGEATTLLTQLKAQSPLLEGDCDLVEAFGKALAVRDFAKATSLLHQMTGKLSNESVGARTQDLDDVRSPPLELGVRAFSATPTKYSRKKIKIGPLTVASNEVSNQTLRACEPDQNSFVGHSDVCIDVSYAEVADATEWRDLAKVDDVTIVAIGTLDASALAWGGRWLEATRILRIDSRFPAGWPVVNSAQVQAIRTP